MVNPISSPALPPVGPSRPAVPPSPASPATEEGGFAAQLRQQLDQVNQMQNEADESIQRLLTGQSDNITAVFTTARKAEVAFSLLMEIRNKLMDAYNELRQLRV